MRFEWNMVEGGRTVEYGADVLQERLVFADRALVGVRCINLDSCCADARSHRRRRSKSDVGNIPRLRERHVVLMCRPIDEQTQDRWILHLLSEVDGLAAILSGKCAECLLKDLALWSIQIARIGAAFVSN